MKNQVKLMNIKIFRKNLFKINKANIKTSFKIINKKLIIGRIKNK